MIKEENDRSRAALVIDKDYRIGAVDERLFGSFIEHLGRAVYDGIYCPDHPTADENGFREDVIEQVKALGVSVVRYPGGNFVSNYDWKDGVGPRENRPKRLELAWRSLETNRVGLNEFASWAKKAETNVMMAVNLGTGGIKEACELLEYCNLSGGTKYSDLRIKHGYKDPHNIRLWCLGNEMDGPWQIGHKTMQEYGRLAVETAKAMRQIDPDIELVSCGSSNLNMPTFPEWERVTLEETYEAVDYVSMHQYYALENDDLSDFLARSDDMDRFIRSVISTCDYVQAKKRGRKQLNISFDEWNVWYHSLKRDDERMKNDPWKVAPPLLEEDYTAADALLVGLMLITLLHHSDRVKIACLAQLVNVIAPIMTERGAGACYRQTIFFPFMQASMYGRGVSMMTKMDSPKMKTSGHGEVDAVAAAAVLEEETGTLTIFAVNRDLSKDVEMSLDLRGWEGYRPILHEVLESDDPSAVNTALSETVGVRKTDRTKKEDGKFYSLLKAGGGKLECDPPGKTGGNGMKVYSVYDAEFARYGRVVKGLPTEGIMKALRALRVPEKVEYVPEEPSLMTADGATALGLAMYGGLPWQMGVCCGHNRKLNCLEYHRDSEFNLGTDDFVLLVAVRDEIQDGVLDTAKVNAFRVPAGVLVEVYATTLHYAPCDTSAEGFMVLIALPKGTNYPLETIEKLTEEGKTELEEGSLLRATNKWLLAHPESAEAEQGAYIGLKGTNLELRTE